MATNKNIPPPVQFVDPKTGFLTRPANNFLNSITRSSNQAVSGEVLTLPGSGLDGGGAVADGLELSIAPAGVSNAMLRDSQPYSVIGRSFSTTGTPADIKAVQNRVALTRQSDVLAFTPSVDVPSVVCDNLTINATPAASTATVTHSIPIETDSGTMYILLSSTP